MDGEVRVAESLRTLAWQRRTTPNPPRRLHSPLHFKKARVSTVACMKMVR